MVTYIAGSLYQSGFLGSERKKRCAWDRCLSCTCLKSTPSFVGFFHELLLGALDATEKEAGHTWKAPRLAMDG